MKPKFKENIETLTTELHPIETNIEPKLGLLPGIRAVIFDIYGTLLISGSGDVGTATATNSTTAAELAFTDSGLPVEKGHTGRLALYALHSAVFTSHQKSKHEGVAHPEVEIREIWREVVDYVYADQEIDDITNDIIESIALSYEMRVNPTWPMPYASDTIIAIRQAGLRLGIISNAQFYTLFLLESFFGVEYKSLGFEEKLCAWSYRLRQAKPAKEMFFCVLGELKELGITPVETVYVGNDMLNDVFTAKESGCRTILFAGDSRSLRLREKDKRCNGLSADRVVTSLAQILEIVCG